MSENGGGVLHPIGVVAERTGLTPELLRAWERRYGVVIPQRDVAGRRWYTSADVARLRLLTRATEGGRSIGQVSSMEDDELKELVRQDETARRLTPGGEGVPEGVQGIVDTSFTLATAMDGDALHGLLLRAVSTYGVPVFLRAIATPLLRKVGDEWHRGRVSIPQEHLVTAAVRGVLESAIAGVRAPDDAPTLVAATPHGERHEIGALLAAASAVMQGWRVAYLGADLPAEEIARAARQTGARAVALSVVYAPDAKVVTRELGRVRSALPAHVDLLVGGAAASGAPGDVRFISDLDEFDRELRALAT